MARRFIESSWGFTDEDVDGLLDTAMDIAEGSGNKSTVYGHAAAVLVLRQILVELEAGALESHKDAARISKACFFGMFGGLVAGAAIVAFFP